MNLLGLLGLGIRHSNWSNHIHTDKQFKQHQLIFEDHNLLAAKQQDAKLDEKVIVLYDDLLWRCDEAFMYREWLTKK